MAVEKWVAGSGQGLTWGAIFGAEVNSLANGNAVQSSVVVTNGTALDIFCDVSVSLGSVTAAAPAYLGFYLYPLNQDGTTYGDGRFASAAAGPPTASYFVGTFGFPTGAAVIQGMVRGIVMPAGSFKFVLHNQAGVALAASANTISYRTYNRQVV